MTIPKIVSRRCGWLVLAGLVASTGVARAQNLMPPAYEFQKPPEKPAVEWKVQAKGGFLLTSGNSQTGSGILTLDSSRQSGQNKLSLNGGAAYGRSRVLVPITDPSGASTVGLGRDARTTTNEWKTRGRYDRFVTPNNAAYAMAQIGADRIAGKRLYGGGQLGYSRQLLKNEQHTLVVELGYDFSYESYVPSPGKTIGGVSIHSARLFAGELFSLTKETGFSGSFEAMFNLNKEDALNANDLTGSSKGVDAFKDTRLVGKLGINTILRKRLSMAIGFTIKYDQNPAPWPLPSGAPPFEANFLPFADKVDTLTEATLIYTFL